MHFYVQLQDILVPLSSHSCTCTTAHWQPYLILHPYIMLPLWKNMQVSWWSIFIFQRLLESIWVLYDCHIYMHIHVHVYMQVIAVRNKAVAWLWFLTATQRIIGLSVVPHMRDTLNLKGCKAGSGLVVPIRQLSHPPLVVFMHLQLLYIVIYWVKITKTQVKIHKSWHPTPKNTQLVWLQKKEPHKMQPYTRYIQ